jgi:hypothetical protein
LTVTLPNLTVRDIDTTFDKALNMNNNAINNVLNINSTTNINLNPSGNVAINGDVDIGSNRILAVPEIIGDGGDMTIRNGAGESILLNSATNTIDILNNNLNMNNNRIVCGDYETTTSFITFFGLGGITPTFTPSGLDMNNGSVNSVSSINNITPVGGLFAGTADSLTLTASTTEQSILPTAFVGTLNVPPNGFAVGDSFHLVLAGDFSSQNSDTVNIRLYAGATSTVLLADLAVSLVSSSGVSFEVEVDFQLRTIGGAGVADICSNFDFTYNGGAGDAFRGERGVFQNNTTFDTTTNNVLLITAQFSSANANNSIKTLVSKLSKTY